MSAHDASRPPSSCAALIWVFTHNAGIVMGGNREFIEDLNGAPEEFVAATAALGPQVGDKG